MGLLGSLGKGYMAQRMLGGSRGRGRGYGGYRGGYGGGYRRGYGSRGRQVRGGCCCIPIPLLFLASSGAVAKAVLRRRG